MKSEPEDDFLMKIREEIRPSRQHVDREKRIREIAYEKWVEAGKPFSNGVEFWLAAEKDYESASHVIWD